VKTRWPAFDAHVVQGRVHRVNRSGLKYQKQVRGSISNEFRTLLQKNSAFIQAFTRRYESVLATPPRQEGRIWLENQRHHLPLSISRKPSMV